jgi:hypothetical protein
LSGAGDEGPTPVSWLLIERGWKVVAADGSEIGTVDEVVGDSSHDIFDGLTVKTGFVAKPKYVPAEQVGEIVEGRVTLRLSADQAQHLTEYEQPGTSERVLPEGGSWWTRLLDSMRGRR